MNIRNIEYLKQPVDYATITFGPYGRKRPTDIDLFYEEDNKLFIFAEFKYGEKDMDEGQFLALTRLVDALSASHAAVLFVCKHTSSPHELICAADSVVTHIYQDGTMERQDEQTTLLTHMSAFRDKHRLRIKLAN